MEQVRVCKNLIYRRKGPKFLLLLFATVLSYLFVTELDKYVPAKTEIKKLVPSNLLNFIDKNFPDSSIEDLREPRYGHTCSQRASHLGYHQKVVSYSFRQSVNAYWIGLNDTIKTIGSLYSGWYVRLYATREDIRFLKSKISAYSYLFYCDVNRINPPLGSLTYYPVTLWRFAPMGDPQVDLALFRDSDSQIIQREVDAVNEWLLHSNKSVHIMRDHPAHDAHILGGMFGTRLTESSRMRMRDMRDKMFNLAYRYSRPTMDLDSLKIVVWDTSKHDMLVHDSYCCTKYEGSSPWPTQRSENKHFVGAAYYKKNSAEQVSFHCPPACRPKKHPTWYYC